MNSSKDHIRNYICDGTPESVIDRYAELPIRAQMGDYGEFDTNIVVLDTETTGFSLNHDELTQIAAARIEKGEITEWFVTFVNPAKPIPDDVAHLTNIHDEDVCDAPMPAEALSALVDFVGDAKVVAHNAEFDRNFTTKHPAGYALLENTWIDSLDLARIALPRMKSHRLIDLVKAFGAPLSTHRADEDVAATCALYRILLAGVEEMPKTLVREISKMADSADWPTVSVFEYFAQKPQDCSGSANAGSVAGVAGLECAERAERMDGAADVSRETSMAYAGSDMETPLEGEGFSDETLFPEFRLPLVERFSLRGLRTKRLANCAWRPKKDVNESIQSGDLGEEPYSDVSGYAPNGSHEGVFHVKHSDVWVPDRETVKAAFSPEGTIGSLFEAYEMRAEQVCMSEAVRSALDKDENLSVEAGTGVGKSMAYLLPLTMLAAKNDINVGVATKTNALLDQLMYQELPRLQNALEKEGLPFTYCALKGYAHYPCLRKVERIVNDGPRKRLVGTKECSQAPALAALLSFIEQTEYDDIDSLKIDYRTLPRKSITTTSHECLKRKCPFYGVSCFVHGSRRKAESSHVVVTNHSLFFCDLAADNGLLPPIRYWVIDEAHGAESEARRAFSLELPADEMRYLSQRVSSSESSRNVFLRAERVVVPPSQGESGTLFFALTNKAKMSGTAFSTAVEAFCDHMRDLLVFDPNKRSKGYESVDLWINDTVRASEQFRSLVSYGKDMVEKAERLVTACQELVAYLEDVENAAVIQREIASIAMELKDVIRSSEVILFNPGEQYVYSATLSKKNDRPGNKIEAMLLNVGEILNETLYENSRVVVYASATLAVGHSFDSFERAMGLNESEASRAGSLILDSSYDYDRNMAIYVAKDMPEPNDPQYLAKLQELLIGVHLAQNGSMLTLFTNRKEMEKCFEGVNPALKEHDLRLVCQKWGVSVKGLRDDFLADEHLSLFALKSFWEGFDAPGATLKGVVVPKLPFAKPTDPLSCERSARDDQAWRKYVLPAAILETKQAAGRLIRRADDKGALILADKRLLTKSYGRSFLNSMPSRNIKVLSIREIVDELGELR